jgi:hypothetical protein
MGGGVSGGLAPPFLTSALDRGEWSASRPIFFLILIVIIFVNRKDNVKMFFSKI